MPKKKTPVRLAIAGVGNCASSFVEGLSWYRQHPRDRAGLLFPALGGYSVDDIEIVAALEAGCAFVNCIPTIYAQRPEVRSRFRRKKLPVLGDDIKSQLGTTILHRTLLRMLQLRGAELVKTSQVNIGGNTDFANFVHRAETKLVSKRKSMVGLLGNAAFHVGHHYDPTRGPLKHAFIDIDATVFAGSRVRISVELDSDDKPNSAGSVVDLIRLAKAA